MSAHFPFKEIRLQRKSKKGGERNSSYIQKKKKKDARKRKKRLMRVIKLRGEKEDEENKALGMKMFWLWLET